MIYVLLTILCSTTVSIVFKLSQGRAQNRIIMILVNYITAMIASAVMWRMSGSPATLSKAAMILAPIGGVVLPACFLLYMVAIRKYGVALPVVLMRLASMVPVVASIIFFGESPTALKVLGLIGALIAAALMSIGISGGEMAIRLKKQSKLVLFATAFILLLGFGMAELKMKLFAQLGLPEEKSFYLFTVFAIATIFVIGVALVQRIKPTGKDIAWGIALGLPNLGSIIFIISSLKQLPTYFVFPSVATGSVMLTVLIAVFGFKERLAASGLVGVILTVASIIAINV